MGSRGASAGIADNGKRYGTEFTAKAQFGEVKFVVANQKNVTPPMETMTKGRIYATLDKDGDIKHITYYDTEGDKVRQVDLKGKAHNGVNPPHTHNGYEHDGGFYPGITERDQKKIESIIEWWKRNRKKHGY